MANLKFTLTFDNGRNYAALTFKPGPPLLLRCSQALQCTQPQRFLHLNNWEANLRDQLLRHRRELYRQFTSELLRKRGRLFIEKLDLRSLAGRNSGRPSLPRYDSPARFIAAPGLLARVLETKGATAIDPQLTTRMCSWCGVTEDWDQAKELIHRCGRCGTLFDQDHNAARNILQRGLAQEAQRNQPRG